MKSKLAQELKKIRKDETQEQLAMKLNVSRESVSKYENGHVKPPADVSRAVMKNYDEPRFALAIRNEYTKTGAKWIDGPEADTHRAVVKEKALDDLQKLHGMLGTISFTKPFDRLKSFDLPQLDCLLLQTLETVQVLEVLIVVITEESDIHYGDTWNRLYKKLKAKGLTT